MNLVDLTRYYITDMLGGDGLSAYEQSYPSLFRHYFEYWGERASFAATLDAETARQRSALVSGAVERLRPKLRSQGLDTTDLIVVLFVGQGTSNGHAFRDNGSFVVWLPVETYHTDREADVFVLHEIAHALHYRRQPEFYFDSRTERDLVSRQLITEGLATYISMRLLKTDEGTALWADFLPAASLRLWLNQCRECESHLHHFILAHFTSSDPAIGLFHAADPDDVFHYRAGYYVGLRSIRSIVRTHKLQPADLFELPRREFERLVLEYLTGCGA